MYDRLEAEADTTAVIQDIDLGTEVKTRRRLHLATHQHHTLHTDDGHDYKQLYQGESGILVRCLELNVVIETSREHTENDIA